MNRSILLCLVAVATAVYAAPIPGGGLLPGEATWVWARSQKPCSQVCGDYNFEPTIVGRYHGQTPYYLCGGLMLGLPEISGIVRIGVNLEPIGSTSPAYEYVKRVSTSCFLADGTYERTYKCLCEARSLR
ncbi:PREDICTED: uncharacterized protein LOC106804663 [Priapulus caudatus]|uniref:Uncharacterized protein LOC106804663 n=1 Tax=Priapulus caudatus TaxID=37621 RepID=A0ABM1DNA1_PRICU|nr:PREDICTED: uncharacterized protein LOC106804663 [Priapulus caudatus]